MTNRNLTSEIIDRAIRRTSELRRLAISLKSAWAEQAPAKAPAEYSPARGRRPHETEKLFRRNEAAK